MNRDKIGVVDVGGGFRGIYAAGVLDYCMDMKASSAIPFVCHTYLVKGIPYFDGALSDTIPIQKAFELGCEKAGTVPFFIQHTAANMIVRKQIAFPQGGEQRRFQHVAQGSIPQQPRF